MPFDDSLVTLTRNNIIAVSLGLTGLGIAIAYAIVEGRWGYLAVPITGLAIVFRMRDIACELNAEFARRINEVAGQWRDALEMGRAIGREEAGGAVLRRLPSPRD